MTFKPFPCRSRWEGLLVTSWIVLVDLLLMIWIWRRPVDWSSFVMGVGVLVSLPLLAHVAYRTWGAFNLEYWLDRNALHVRWAATEQIVPLQAVRRVIRGGSELRSRNWTAWPAPYVRSGTGLGLLHLERFASRPLSDCLLLETEEATFAVSPIHQERFLAALQAYRRIGPIQTLPIERRRPTICDAAFDRSLILLAAGLVGVLILFGVLMWRYPSLPERLIFHYNSAGAPDSIRPKRALFLLPTIGLFSFLVNGVGGIWMSCRRQQTGACLLWGGTLIVQVLVLLALISLMG